jgi:hypothetical protein
MHADAREETAKTSIFSPKFAMWPPINQIVTRRILYPVEQEIKSAD